MHLSVKSPRRVSQPDRPVSDQTVTAHPAQNLPQGREAQAIERPTTGTSAAESTSISPLGNGVGDSMSPVQLVTHLRARLDSVR